MEKGSGTLPDRKRLGPDESGQQVTLYCDLRASVYQASCLHDGILASSEAEVQVLINPQLQYRGYRLQRRIDKNPGKVAHGAPWAKALKVPTFMPDYARPGLKARR